ncbi:hypothetical protein [Shewanella oncorhynchi]|uniref:hypothetical protein n=1 Tax=Shewanella oncorhynchi TaxID=2726434 RepID=UPI003D7AE255
MVTTTYKVSDHTFAWNMNYTAGTYAKDKAIDAAGLVLVPEGDLDSWLIHNLSYTYNAGDFGSVTLMVNNLTDEDPILNEGAYDNADLYNNYGREYRASYTIKF